MGDQYIIVNSIQGSFHQGNVEKFGEMSGRQCTCMTLFTIAYLSFKSLGIWNNCDLDVILMNENQSYKSLDRTDYLSVTDFPETFQVESIQVNAEYNINEYGTLRNGTVSAEDFQRFSDQSATKGKGKVHYFLCKVFVLLYSSKITVYTFFDSHS